MRNAPWNWNEIVTNPQGRATSEFLSWLQQQLTTAELAGAAVPQSRLITAGVGLLGGGDLSVDRTLALDTTNTRNVDHSAISINPGTGLTGGGNLTASRTLTLADTAVTPGSYTNTNLTVDAQGRITTAANGSGGGGSSLEVPPTIPTSASFTLQNTGTSSLVNGTYGMTLVAPTAAANIRFAKYSAAVLASTWIMTTRAQAVNREFSNAYPGCFIARNSSNGRIVISGSYNGTQFLVQRWTGYTTFTSNVYGPFTVTDNSSWYQMEKTATTLIYRWSPNGEQWFTYYTETIASFLTAAGGSADEFGIGVMVDGDAADTVFQSFTVV